MPKRIDLSGKTFGKWTVVNFDKFEKSNTYWICRCECGTVKSVNGSFIRKGVTTHCGCSRRIQKNFSNLLGIKFNRLTVAELVGKNKSGNYLWRCKCDCGNYSIVNGGNLKSGHAQSCGCLQKERASACNIKHGKTKTNTYHSWFSMIQRCYNPKNISYKSYGSKGITVCDNWKESFINFLNDMGECPKGMSIDRIDFNGNYVKENCKWSTEKEQQNNKSSKRFITYKGETNTLTMWAEKIGLNPTTLHDRLFRYNWTLEKAFTTNKGCASKYTEQQMKNAINLLSEHTYDEVANITGISKMTLFRYIKSSKVI